MMRAVLAILVACVAVAHAACPFAGLAGASDALPSSHRRLLQRPGGGGGGGGGRPQNGPQPTCNLADLLTAGPLTPEGPATQTNTDAAVKAAAYDVILRALRLADGTPNTQAPLGGLVRAAFHDAGTYNRAARTGGANGSLRSERNDPAHDGLAPALNLVTTLRTRVNARLTGTTAISFADMYQLAGAVAVEVTGGPSSLYASVPVGRVDAAAGRADSVAQLPDRNDNVGTLECEFLGNGYTVKELVALSGAHTVGFVRRGGGGRDPMSPTPFSFNTDYFNLVLAGRGLLRSDNALAADAARTLPLVRTYAGDQAAFFRDFAAAYVKMGKMGATWRSYTA